MTKTDICKNSGMDEFIWGDCFEIAIDHFNSNTKHIELLDTICVNEQLKPLADKWQKIDFDECCDLLLNALHFDLAYQNCENMPYEKALYFQKNIIEKINKNDCHCYSNWFQNPWKTINGASWNPVTENTFDMAIVFIDSKKVIFTYFISED